jgi:phosphoglucomutase/phosphomannomutase
MTRVDPPRIRAALELCDAAVTAGKLTAGSRRNVEKWLTESGYAAYVERILAMIEQAKFAEVDAAFWEVTPFGTGGRRGPMGELGSATINERTIAESAHGLAQYFKTTAEGRHGRAVIAYDTRNRSAEFARITACTLAANGMKVYLFDGHRSTPALSFAVRHLKCDVGAMISASHNPPADNGFKAYWSNGAQVLPPHDKGIIDCVYAANEIPTVDFDAAVKEGRIELIGAEVDSAFITAILAQRLGPPSDISILYTPLHGVGETSVYRVLKEAGFTGVRLFEPQRNPSGDFPHVPNQAPNPELGAVFSGELIHVAASMHAECVFASDPDADRLGVAVRAADNNYVHLTGNRIGILLADYILRRRMAAGTLSPRHYVVETLVTTPLIAALARKHGVRAFDDLLVGFKYIGQTMDREDPNLFVFGTEESLGYLAGQYCRDKDAGVAALLLAEYAAELRTQKKTLLDRLDELFVEFGYHHETQKSETCQGPRGKELIGALMQQFAEMPPTELAGIRLARVRDYGRHEVRELPSNNRTDDLPEPKGDLVIFESAAGETEISFAARPSGTEPKIKFYFFARARCPSAEKLAEVKTRVDAQLTAFQQALSGWVKGVWSAG